ncbi:hypothetical protein pb186bvf_010648 [Paramecium bursaria]
MIKIFNNYIYILLYNYIEKTISLDLHQLPQLSETYYFKNEIISILNIFFFYLRFQIQFMLYIQ